jgi:hypothetical protein
VTEIGNFNKLPKEMREKLPVLREGESATYELLVADIDLQTGRPLYGGSISLPGRDVISDGKGNAISIGIPRKIEGNRVVKCEKFIRNGGGPNGMVPGRFELSGDNLEHIQWHQFFSICNFNESNPSRNKATKPLIKLVDHEAEAKVKTKKRTALLDALTVHQAMSADDIRVFAAARNWNSLDDIRILTDKVGEYAQNSPIEFLKEWKDPDTKKISELRMAMDLAIIGYDPVSHQYKWPDGTVLATLARSEGKTPVELLHDALKNTKDGSAVMQNIRKKVNGANRQALIKKNANADSQEEEEPEQPEE